jgi:hypothetical protein
MVGCQNGYAGVELFCSIQHRDDQAFTTDFSSWTPSNGLRQGANLVYGVSEKYLKASRVALQRDEGAVNLDVWACCCSSIRSPGEMIRNPF